MHCILENHEIMLVVVVTTAGECQVYPVSRNAEVAGLIIIIPGCAGTHGAGAR